MALPKVIDPAQSSTHRHGAQNTFKWDAGVPTVTPTHWRLLIGATPGGWQYYRGTPVAEPAHQDVFAFTTTPPAGRICYTLVEWSTDGGTTFPNQGDIISFICKP